MADREISRGRERLTIRVPLILGHDIDGPNGPQYSGAQLVLASDVTAVVAVIDRGLVTYRRVMAVTTVHSSTIEVAGQPSPARMEPPKPRDDERGDP